jgi:dTDP-4-amino-4,6-dideoxygalactose transaminase
MPERAIGRAVSIDTAMRLGERIYVTQPSLPPIEEYISFLNEIWERRYVTNNGPVLQCLEAALAEYLGVKHITLVANATLALMMALRGLQPGDEVITSPFSFVASAHAIKWAGGVPVFADINRQTLNLDPSSVAASITSRTRAILAVHCFGIPCDSGLESIARESGLRLIFDAAHAFGVHRNGESILCRGDSSIISFHATKVFSTVEGGAIVSPDRETKMELDRACNFGIVDEASIPIFGLNAKMSELHAAFGLALLPYANELIRKRKQVAERYIKAFSDVSCITCVCSANEPGHNFYAFPILISPGSRCTRDALYTQLKNESIHARRYFYPLLSDLALYGGPRSDKHTPLTVARDVSDRILCLPMFPHLEPTAQERIISIVRSTLLQ